jgi:hypothetical protein
MMNSWQPIETAPQDGKPLDLWVVCVNLQWRPEGEHHRVTDAFWKNGEWLVSNPWLDEIVPAVANEYRATHWMRVEPPGRRE